MKRIGFAVAMTAFAAVGASAQTGGTAGTVTAVTVEGSPMAQACVVSAARAGVTAFRTADANGALATTIVGSGGGGMMARSVAPTERAGSEIAVGSFTRGAVTDASGAQKFSMTRAADGTITVTSADGKEIPLTKDANGVVTARTADGVIEMRATGVAVHSNAEAATVVDTKEAPKYHVKRPPAKLAEERIVDGYAISAARAGAVGGGAMRASVVTADGVSTVKPAECRVLLREGGNW